MNLRVALGYFVPALAVVALTVATAPLDATRGPPPPPESPHRPADQTFLTFPEWFLVWSPEEFATFIADRPPSEFPYFGHVGQFWNGYRRVCEATRGYPPNPGYHVMIDVIGVSTTIEYASRSVYETMVGRLAELTRMHGPTEEERLAARYARDYADFLRVRPWYEYDFVGQLRSLWTTTSALGPDLPRKWERKYALTQELLVKAAYGQVIKWATQSAYDAPVALTDVRLASLPAAVAGRPGLTVRERAADGSVLVTVPRYAAFTDHARALARLGARFVEIAGNRGAIVVSVLVPYGWRPPAAAPYDILLEQPILTNPKARRVVVVQPVGRLADTLLEFDGDQFLVEHVYDY